MEVTEEVLLHVSRRQTLVAERLEVRLEPAPHGHFPAYQALEVEQEQGA